MGLSSILAAEIRVTDQAGPWSLPLGGHHQSGRVSSVRMCSPLDQSRRAVAPVMLCMDTADIPEKVAVGRRVLTLRKGSPVVVAAVRDFDHAAHESHWPGARMLLDESEHPLGISAKMPIAF